MPKTYDGTCYCGAVKWKVVLQDSSEGRTSLCHCFNCKKFFGTNYGITTKVPWPAFSYGTLAASPASASATGPPPPAVKTHISDNNGSKLTRQFCGTCGSPIREWGEQAAGKYTYVCYGGLDEAGRKELPPKAEFFVAKREEWCKDVGGEGGHLFAFARSGPFVLTSLPDVFRRD